MGINTNFTCRICLENGANINIFLNPKETRRSVKVACHTMMSVLFSFATRKGDSLPPRICQSCATRLTSAYQLKILAEASFKQLSAKLKSATLMFKEESNEEKSFNNLPVKAKDESPLLQEPSEEDVSNREDPLLLSNFEKKDLDLNMADFQLRADDDDFIILEVGGRQSPYNEIQIDDVKIEDLIFQKRKVKRVQKLKKAPGASSARRRLAGGSSGVCEVCGAMVGDLAAHRAAHAKPRPRLLCPCCPKLFTSYTARTKHHRSVHLGQLYHCQLCNKDYKSGYEHRRLVHSAVPRSFPCVMCDKTFLTQAKLRHHVTVHTLERAFPCPVCAKGFRSRAESEYHRRNVHEREKKFTCEICQKGFFFSQNFKVHSRSHTKEKLFGCKLCLKAFTTKSQLSTHELRHSGVKEVICIICEKGFINNSGLKNHILTHTKERSHACRFCSTFFARADHRNKHEKSAHKFAFTEQHEECQ